LRLCRSLSRWPVFTLIARDAGHNPDHVVHHDEVPRLETVGYRLRPDPRGADLTVRILWIGKIHVQGDLTVDAHGLNFPDDYPFGSFQHCGSCLSDLIDRRYFRVKIAEAPNIRPVSGWRRTQSRSAAVGDTMSAFSF